jgi:hypothetical protein
MKNGNKTYAKQHANGRGIMPLYSPPSKMLAVYEAARGFIFSVNDEISYEECREEILRKFNSAREANRSIIEQHENIHEYLRNLSSHEVKLASLSRRLKIHKCDEEIIREKDKLRQWFKQQEDEIEKLFGPYIFQK